MDHKIVTYRKKYRKLDWPVFHTARPYTGSGYYIVNEMYDHYYRRRFMFTAQLVRKVAPVKIKDISERFISTDVDPPHNTVDGFYRLMEKMYKKNYFRPNFWKDVDTEFNLLWFQRSPELSKWA